MTAPALDLEAIRARYWRYRRALSVLAPQEGIAGDVQHGLTESNADVDALLAHIERLTAERDEARLDRANLVDDAAERDRENGALRARVAALDALVRRAYEALMLVTMNDLRGDSPSVDPIIETLDAIEAALAGSAAP